MHYVCILFDVFCFSNDHLITCFLSALLHCQSWWVDDVQLPADSETRHCRILVRHRVLEAVQLYGVGRWRVPYVWRVFMCRRLALLWWQEFATRSVAVFCLTYHHGVGDGGGCSMEEISVLSVVDFCQQLGIICKFASNLESSANLKTGFVRPHSRSLINIKNRIGPKTEPWGTPLVTGLQSEQHPFTHSLTSVPQPFLNPVPNPASNSMLVKFLH